MKDVRPFALVSVLFSEMAGRAALLPLPGGAEHRYTPFHSRAVKREKRAKRIRRKVLIQDFRVSLYVLQTEVLLITGKIGLALLEECRGSFFDIIRFAKPAK